MSVPFSNKQTAPQLVDVVVFACGHCKAMKPLAASSTAKAMLPICNRPMIWYCLQPWIKAGFTRFFICVDHDYAPIEYYLRSTFADAPKEYQFFFVVVHSQHSATSSDAVKAFLQFKKDLRRHNGDDYSNSGEDFQRSTVSGELDEPRREISGYNTSSPFASPREEASVKSRRDLLQESAAMALGPRDAFLIHVDTIVSNVDIELFVKSFYLSMSSVLMMLVKPLESTTSTYAITQAAAKKAEEIKRISKSKGGDVSSHGKGGKAKQSSSAAAKKAPASIEFPSFQHEYACVVYEEEAEHYRKLYEASAPSERVDLEGGGGEEGSLLLLSGRRANSDTSMRYPDSTSELYALLPRTAERSVEDLSSAPPPEVVPPHHHRLHFITPATPNFSLHVSLPYAARRPRLLFEKGVVDPQVCLVRHWVLEYIASSCCCHEDEPSLSVEEGVLPLLVRSQHAQINVNKRVLISPEKKLNFPIPLHWFFSGEGRQKVKNLNAGNNEFLPENVDSLMVGAVVYEEHPQSSRRFYKLNNIHNYVSANREVMACRAVSAALATSSSSPAPSCSPLQSALSNLLPDACVHLQEKIGSQGLYIQYSFIRSLVPTNTYITRSTIGADVKVAAGVRITDSVIMRGAEIHAGAEISRSIVGEAASIVEGVKITNSVCGPHTLVEESVTDDNGIGEDEEEER